jgi:hypothetical protein
MRFMGSWIRNLNFVLFVVNILIMGEIEKPSGQFLGLIEIERLGDAVCDLYRAQGDEHHEFLGLTSKPRSTVLSLVCVTSHP